MLRFIKLRIPQTACFQNKVLWCSAQCNYTMMASTTLIMEPLWMCYQLTRVDLSTRLNRRSTNSQHTLINQTALTPTCGSTNRLSCQGEARSPPHRATNTNFFVLCNWIKTRAPRHAVKSSPDEPRLEKLWQLSTNCGCDKADRQPVMGGCGPAEPSPQAGSTQDFTRANDHLL